MRITPFFWTAASVVLSVVAGCGHGRAFQPAGWTCFVYHMEPLAAGDICRRDSMPVAADASEAEVLFERSKDPFLVFNPQSVESVELADH